MMRTGRGFEVLTKRQVLWIHMQVWKMNRAEQAYSAATEEGRAQEKAEDSIQLRRLFFKTHYQAMTLVAARAPVAAVARACWIKAVGGHCWTAMGSAAAMDWSAGVESRPVRSKAATRLSVSLRRLCRFRRSSLIMRATRRRCALSWGELAGYRRESQVS